MGGDLVLHAVEALDHLEVEPARRPPADGGRDQDHVGPVHQPLVDLGQLIGGIPLGDRAGPGAGVARLGVVPLTGPEIEIAKPYQPGVGAANAPGVLERVLQQRVAGAVPGIPGIHRRGGQAEDAGRGAGGLGVVLQQMRRFVLDQLARHDRWRLDPYSVQPLLDGEDRHLLLIEALGAAAGDDAVFPAVPWAHHVLAVEPPLAQRAAAMVAAVGNGAKGAVVMKDRDAVAIELHREGSSCEQFVPTAEAVPGVHGDASGGEDQGTISRALRQGDARAPARRLELRPSAASEPPACRLGSCSWKVTAIPPARVARGGSRRTSTVPFA